MTSSTVARALSRRLRSVAAPSCSRNAQRLFCSSSSSSSYSSQPPPTTYSGGHPHEGQGGFYGSIKSRSDVAAEFVPGARAEAADVQQLNALIAAWDAQATALTEPDARNVAWNVLVRDAANTALIKRLIVKGGPAWGLSSKQREFVSRFHPV